MQLLTLGFGKIRNDFDHIIKTKSENLQLPLIFAPT